MAPLRAGRRIGDPRRPLLFWLAVGWVGFALLPWYGVEEGILDPAWLTDGWAWDDYYAPGLFQGLWHDKPWLLPHVPVPGAAGPGAPLRRHGRLPPGS